MVQGVIPSDLLLLAICPIHKGGLRSVPKNFCPVALMSHLIKVFERVVRKALVRHLQDNGHMSPGQHGFQALRSTLTQLLEHWDSLLDDLLAGAAGCDTVYLDFSKAFNKVDHGVLLHKLREFGVCGKIGIWLAAFLNDRYWWWWMAIG